MFVQHRVVDMSSTRMYSLIYGRQYGLRGLKLKADCETSSHSPPTDTPFLPPVAAPRLWDSLGAMRRERLRRWWTCPRQKTSPRPEATEAAPERAKENNQSIANIQLSLGLSWMDAFKFGFMPAIVAFRRVLISAKSVPSWALVRPPLPSLQTTTSMSSPFANYPVPERSFIPQNPSRPIAATESKPAGAKRGRKPKNANTSAVGSPVVPSGSLPLSQPAPMQWSTQQASSIAGPSTPASVAAPSPAPSATAAPETQSQGPTEGGPVLSLPGVVIPQQAATNGDATQATARHSAAPGAPAGEEDVEGEDEMLPAMADDDYSAQLSWQSQSKDNLKYELNPAQYDRFEAYRRHALPKQAVRKVIQQTLGQQVSQPVAQIVAGFGKVFVGEIVEKAREVQARRGEHGPLSPDHLREAYRLYQQETGRVGAARPLRSKRIFVK
ncbi:hypothetical protein NM688_g9092 [Phlebia brevispora]|uniref:Uncharacterized protein n=1 Tax=Phlebia brevispora TaxID=194682 RepID=A0ACC1RN04_9APHY|nr:hypothetical protein NM688_g9092 [Phlebia brevispora]